MNHLQFLWKPVFLQQLHHPVNIVYSRHPPELFLKSWFLLIPYSQLTNCYLNCLKYPAHHEQKLCQNLVGSDMFLIHHSRIPAIYCQLPFYPKYEEGLHKLNFFFLVFADLFYCYFFLTDVFYVFNTF